MGLRRIVAIALLACTVPLAAACSGPPPPERHASPAHGPTSVPASPPASPAAGTPTQSTLDGSQPAPPGGSTATAVSCNGKPAAAEIVTMLKNQGMVAKDARVTITTGPLCVDDWQYTVVSVPETDPLQVVTRMQGGKLTFVTAGTDICEAETLTSAPAAIRSSAHCLP